MARKLRIQYPGAIYHVINRGNYRKDVFDSVGAAQAFEETLFEACALNGWKLHAYVVMRNHYHLALETPRGNLSEGMHWLQGTFATRFNRLRTERGYLFQGRYHALLVEDMAALARVVDYIHLNPSRAGAVMADQLAVFRWSSLRRFVRGPRVDCLVADDWLKARGFTQNTAGVAAYVEDLVRLAGDEREQRLRGLAELSKGWAIGTQGWRRAIATEHSQRALDPGLAVADLNGLKESHWSLVLTDSLFSAGRTLAEALSSRANADWKIETALALRNAGAPYRWITQRLNMGTAATARVYCTRVKK